jgi:hypothetical protein
LDGAQGPGQRRAEGVRMLAETCLQVKSHFLCASKQLGMTHAPEMQEALPMLAHGIDFLVCQMDWPVGLTTALVACP